MPFTKIDHHIGSRLRLRRKMLRISQPHLAKEIGVDFRQVHKYEHGINRISCSRLYEISKALDVSPLFFFEGLSGIKIQNYIFAEEVSMLKLIHDIDNIKNIRIRELLVKLISEVAKNSKSS
jgi:transcriptional regulator with XRE-family HTH domain